MDTVPFFAPSFFSPYYFAPYASSDPPDPATPPQTFRDRDVFDAIVAALAATGEFADAILGEPVERGNLGADRVPLVILTPIQWEEDDDWDPTALVRRVVYNLTVVVRDDEPGGRYDLLDRLSSLIQNTLDGSTLNGGCLPTLSKIRRGRLDPDVKNPEQRLALLGEFAYVVNGYQSHLQS